MKTSELKKIIEERGFDFDDQEENIFIRNNNIIFGMVKTKNNTAYIEKGLPQIIAKVLLDYAYTPLEEREEEKKFVLIAPIHKRAEMHLYVYFDDIEKKYYLDDLTNENDQNIFSQKEIDAMPFDTNFFIKEEFK